jgi:hypothetical protein
MKAIVMTAHRGPRSSLSGGYQIRKPGFREALVDIAVADR